MAKIKCAYCGKEYEENEIEWYDVCDPANPDELLGSMCETCIENVSDEELFKEKGFIVYDYLNEWEEKHSKESTTPT